MVFTRVSTVASASIANTPSLMSSYACGPMMWTPRISPYFATATTCTKPYGRPRLAARARTDNGTAPADSHGAKEIRFPALADKNESEGKANGSHHDGSDKKLDQAILHTDNETPYGFLVGVSAAI